MTIAAYMSIKKIPVMALGKAMTALTRIKTCRYVSELQNVYLAPLSLHDEGERRCRPHREPLLSKRVFSIHRGGVKICLQPADLTDSWRLRRATAPARGEVSHTAHKTHKREHYVMILEPTLPPPAAGNGNCSSARRWSVYRKITGSFRIKSIFFLATFRGRHNGPPASISP